MKRSNSTLPLCAAKHFKSVFLLKHMSFLTRQAKKDCLVSVRKDGNDLQHIIKQSQKICFAAVKEDGRALQSVKDKKAFFSSPEYIYSLLSF